MVEMVKVRHNTKFATIANTVTEKSWFSIFKMAAIHYFGLSKVRILTVDRVERAYVRHHAKFGGNQLHHYDMSRSFDFHDAAAILDF